MDHACTPNPRREFEKDLKTDLADEMTYARYLKLDTLLSFQGAGQAIGLLGRTVEVVTDSGTVVGQVISTAFENGNPILSVQADNGAFLTGIGLSQIQIVR